MEAKKYIVHDVFLVAYFIAGLTGNTAVLSYQQTFRTVITPLDRHEKHPLMYLHRSNKNWVEHQTFNELDFLGENRDEVVIIIILFQ
jgi:hypothetical protein